MMHAILIAIGTFVFLGGALAGYAAWRASREMRAIFKASQGNPARASLLESENRRLRRELGRDHLTGLGNRRALEERSTARKGWLVLADLDGLKAAQDGHKDGHAHGDNILREFAAFLLQELRSSNRESFTTRTLDRVAARVGGDEFAIWCSTHKGAFAIRDRIRAWRSAHSKVRASAGVGADMRQADAALYVNKRARKSRLPQDPASE